MIQEFDLWVKQIALNRGKPRLWFETVRLEKAGLGAGARYNIKKADGGLQLSVHDDGKYRVSSKEKNGRLVPIIDLNSNEVLGEMSDLSIVRVIVVDGGMWILPLASENAKRERLNRLTAKLKSGAPLLTGSLAHGGGIASHASHAGLHEAGFDAVLAMANEIDETYAEQAASHNKVTMKASHLLVAPIQELVQDKWVMDRLPKLEILELGLPCSGASVAGKAKNGNAMMEGHEQVGHLIYSALAIINQVQPAIVVLENVEGYAKSASAQIMRSQLRDMGYSMSEIVLSARDFGCLENRDRWFFLAATSGLEIDAMAAKPAHQIEPPLLGTVLEDIPLDAECWRELTYLKDKEIRDKEAGKGFSLPMLTAESNKVNVLRKQYAKGGSCDPVVIHPEKPNLLRKFTPTEHAKIKGIPAELVAGLPATTAHQILGQSVIYDVLKAVFRDCVGASLKTLRDVGAKISSSSATLARIESVIG